MTAGLIEVVLILMSSVNVEESSLEENRSWYLRTLALKEEQTLYMRKKSKCLEVVMGNQRNAALGCVDIKQFALGEAAKEAAPYRKTTFQLRQGDGRSIEKTHYVECFFKEEWQFQRAWGR